MPPAETVAKPLKKPVDTLVFASWIVPVQPAGAVFRDHALAISGQQIEAILPAAEARELKATHSFDLSGYVLCPGLVNAHGHAAMSLFRGMADDHPLEHWLKERIWPAESRWVGSDFVSDGAELAIAEMLRGGTTCFSDMYFFPDATARAALRAGIRAQIAFPVLEFPSAWASSADEYIHKGLELRDEHKHEALLRFAFGPHAPYTVSDATLMRIATYAAELDAPVQVHLHETAQEVAEAVAEHGERPLARLHTLGLINPRAQCVHMTALQDDEIELLAAHGAHVVHCPESNLKLASGFCRVADLLAAGVNVALGTDGAASNNDLSLFGEMHTAALLAKAVAGDAGALPAHRALQMATLDGARALGMEQEIGSLEPGKQADVIAIDLRALEHQPLYDPVSQLVYTHCGNQVSHAWVAGRHLLDAGRLPGLDTDAIIERARQWSEKIHSHEAGDAGRKQSP